MINKIFTIARGDKKARKKALQQLDQDEARIDASEVIGGKNDHDQAGIHFIREQASSQLNVLYQNPDKF
jgi:hypothetical protein